MKRVKLGSGFYYKVNQTKEEQKMEDTCFGCCFNDISCKLLVTCGAHSKTIYKNISQIREIKLKEIFDENI